MPDDHLVKIETKLSYQEDLLDELNSIIIRQQKEIDSLKPVSYTHLTLPTILRV